MAKPNVISKNELIESAKECLVTNGIEKFTLKAVAEIAGVTQGTVYYHFRTKEQLLIDITKDICDNSWNEISRTNENLLRMALESSKSRCSSTSYYHKLFLTLITSSFTNERIREQMGDILHKENQALSSNLSKIWSENPVEGVSPDTWGIILNSLIDGIAIQALLVKEFPIEKTYSELEQLLLRLTNLSIQEGNQ
ncbi:TetR/AcrR family transcriptional regulator [Brevibacillus daliensis]|uniref:TetR/AcrR family transcriptional regulator n=1 Tax=Brevibacillus daliensis TaxID=2892995 RepID=UPI001E56D376|nr:TetR/AcrR family transcriptional regulator [Brevibacillus daliensis]